MARNVERAKHPVEQPTDGRQSFGIQVEQVRAQLAARRSRRIIHPRESKWAQYWDTCSLVMVLFTAIVTPYEVGISTPTPIWDLTATQYPLFVINRIVDAFFMVDLGLSFFLAYQLPPHKGGAWVIDQRQIARHYLCSWFPADLISVLPFDLAMSVGLFEGGGSLLRLPRTIRLLRLVKLLRLMRASRILARWQASLGVSFAHMTMIQFMLITTFLVHLMACIWAYVGLNGDLDAEPHRCDGTFQTCWGIYPLAQTSWVVVHHLVPDENPANFQASIYILSFTQVCILSFTQAYTSFPSPRHIHPLLHP